MKKLIFLFCITLGLAQNNGIRSLNGSLNNSQRLTVDTTSSATFRWGLSNGVHTLYLPYRIVNPSGSSFKWNVSGQTAKYDSLRLIAGSNVSLTQSGNTVTIATSGGGSVGNADSLGGVPASDYARLSVANTFTDNNTFAKDTNYFGSSGNNAVVNFWDEALGQYAPLTMTESEFNFGAYALRTTDNFYGSGAVFSSSIQAPVINQDAGGSQLKLAAGNPYSILGGQDMTKEAAIGYVNVFGTKIHVARQTTGGFAYANSADTIRMGHGTFSWNVPFVAGNNTTAAGGVGSALILYNEASDDTSAFTLGQALGVGGSGGTTTTSFTLYKTKGTDPANNDKPDGNKYISLFAVDTSNNILFNSSKSADFSYGNFYLDNGNLSVDKGGGYFDSMLTVMNGGVFYRTASSYDTNYAPVTSYTHNAPAFVKSQAMNLDYYSYIGVSQDAVLGLFSQDEGDHGSTLDLGEVGTTSGAITNKWTIGRGSTSGSNRAALSFVFGTSKDYTLNTTKMFLDTMGNFYLNRNAPVSGTQVGFYIPRGIQRAAFDTSGRVTFSNETASGDWVLGLDTYSAAQGSVLLGRRARGNQSAPAQTQSGDILLFLSGRGYTNSSAFGTNNVGVMRIMANENVTSSAQGTFIDFATTQNGTTSRAVDLILDKVNSGTRATFGATAGTGTGNVYIDSLYVGTTLAIDASRNANLGTITSTGLSTFGDNAGTATIGAGDSVQVTVTGLTVATGQAVVSYKRKGATSVIVADTIATYDINTANKLSIYGKYGWTVSYWIGKK